MDKIGNVLYKEKVYVLYTKQFLRQGVREDYEGFKSHLQKIFFLILLKDVVEYTLWNLLGVDQGLVR